MRLTMMITLNDFPVSLFFVSFAFMIAGLFAWFFAVIKSEDNRLMTMTELKVEVDFIFSYESGMHLTDNFLEEKEKSLKSRAKELRDQYVTEINRLSNEVNEIDHVLDEIEPEEFSWETLSGRNVKFMETSHV